MGRASVDVGEAEEGEEKKEGEGGRADNKKGGETKKGEGGQEAARQREEGRRGLSG